MKKVGFNQLMAVFLALIMTLGLFSAISTTALAAAPVGPSPTEAWDFRSVDANGSGNYGGGSWNWAQATKTLTLNNINHTTSALTAMRMPGDSTIVLNGTNTIKSTSNNGTTASYGLSLITGRLTISGSGSLTITSGDFGAQNYASYGIVTDFLTISGNAAVTAIGGRGLHSGGVTALNVTVSGNASLTANGGAAAVDSNGIVCEGLTINGGTVTATGQTCALRNNYTVPNGHRYYVNITTAPSNDQLIGNGTSTIIGSTHKYARIQLVPTYTLTVSKGTGSGSYAAGDKVSINADAPATGQAFDKWTGGNGGTFGNANSASTTFTMPGAAATVTATYRPLRNTANTALPITVGETKTVGSIAGPGSVNAEMWYHFTVAKPSVVTIDLATVEESPHASGNILRMELYAENDYNTQTSMIRNLYGAGTDRTDVRKQGALENTGLYMVNPGKYFIRAYWILAGGNAYGTVKLAKIAPSTEDFGGEQNDSMAATKNKPAVKTGVVYKGNIAYYGQKGKGRFQDTWDFYRFVVPYNNYGVKLTTTRANTWVNNNIYFYLVDSNGYDLSPRLSMNAVFKASAEFKGLKKGTHYVKLSGGMGGAKPTEYTFRLDEITYPITVQSGGNGTAKADANPAGAGRTVTLTATPKSGYRLKEWQASGGVTVKNNKFVMPASKVTVKAIFERITYKVTAVKTLPTLYIVKGQSLTLPVAVQPYNATNKDASWKTANGSIATVDPKTGKVKGVSVGNTTLTVTTSDGKKTATCKVYVVATANPIKSFTITPNKATIMVVGKTLQVKTTLNPAKATGIVPTYKSSKPSVAFIDKTGVITALKSGTTTITVTAGGKKQTFELSVGKVLPTSITIPKTASVNVGKKLTLDLKWTPSTSDPKTVTWTTDNKAIATVNSNGVVTGVKKGKVVITATTWNGKITKCTVTVN